VRLGEEESKLGKGISRRLRKEMGPLGISGLGLASKIYEDMEVGKSTAATYIRRIRKGDVSEYMPSLQFGFDERAETLMGRLALVLHALNIREDERLIGRIRDVYGSYFKFPPTTKQEREEKRRHRRNQPVGMRMELLQILVREPPEESQEEGQ